MRKVTFQIGLKFLFRGHVIIDLKGEENVETFYEKELQKRIKKNLELKKIIKRKVNKLYVKWKNYDNSINSCIDIF